MIRLHSSVPVATAWIVLFAMHGASNRIGAEIVAIPVFADTTLNEALPGNNMGGNALILSGTDGSGKSRRGLLSFNVADEIPAGAVIHAATLYLTATSANPAAGDFSLYRVLANWGEGAGNGATGVAALPGDATWNSRQHAALLWSAPGGQAGSNYTATSSSTTHVSAADEYAFAGLAADVQFMLDNPASNFGWMLISGREGTAQSARQFIASESGNTAVPRLEVEYSVIPEPHALSLLTTGLAIIGRRRLRHRVMTPSYGSRAKK